MLSLRAYQSAMIEDARAKIRSGSRRILMCLPTGAGKTVLIAQMLATAVAKGKRAWFLVHRRELVRQSVQTFVESADIHTGIIAAGFPATPGAPVQVCSVASLKRRMVGLPAPDLIVYDECHRVAAASWSEIARAMPSTTVHIGLTATPQRLDGRGLRPFFDDLLCGPSTADLIAQGYLAPYRLFAPSTVDVSAVHTVAGDYNHKELNEAMDGSTVVGDAVSTYRQHCPGARALIFAWSVASSRQIAEQFLAAGVEAEHVDGETPTFQREDAMRRFRAGDLAVLCNCELYSEGMDVPAVDAVFLLRPTQSLGLYLQQIGRGLRPAPGKSAVRLFDHAGNWSRHGLPDDPRVWTLDGREKSKRDAAPPAVKRCPECFAISRATARACSACGVAFVVQSREVEQVDGTLQEANVAELRALRERRTELQRDCHTLGEWHALAKRLGYSPGWAYRMWTWRQKHARSTVNA